MDEAIALAGINPQERAGIIQRLFEARVLRALRQRDVPLAALDRALGSVLAELRKVAEEEHGDDFDAALDLLDEREGLEEDEDPADGG